METQMLTFVTTLNKDTMDADLDAAVHAAELVAAKDRTCGILVTRTGYTSFTVETTPEVPFGLIYQKQDFR